MERVLSPTRHWSPAAHIPAPRRVEWPSIAAVIATRERPNLLRRALDSVFRQDYPGPMRIVVVFDGAAPDWRLAQGGQRPVLVLENWRTPGLAGARNTGILAAGDCSLVALCNDDDTWAARKLTAQVSAIRARPGTLFATCALEVEYDGRRTPRLAGVRELDLDLLSRGRARVLRPSGFLARQDALATAHAMGGVGLIAEDAPAGGGDWDLLMRAASRAPIVHVDTPLVRVLWRRRGDADGSSRLRALHWIIDRYPELGAHGPGAARVHAEIACWEAAAGRPAAAWASTRAALRARWYEPSVAGAVVAAAGVLRGPRLLAALHRRVMP